MIRVVPKIVHCDKCSNDIEYEEGDLLSFLENTVIRNGRFILPGKIRVFYIKCPVCKNIIEIERGNPEPIRMR